MKIAIIICSPDHAFAGGVVNQGIMWKHGLELIGHEVDLTNYWTYYDWGKYDSIIMLGMGVYHVPMIKKLMKFNPNVISAPIIDPDPQMSWKSYRRKATYSISWFRHFSGFRGMQHIYYQFETLKAYLVRSEYEANFLNQVFGIAKERIFLVPLSYRNEDINVFPKKENFCLHVSRLDSAVKNVPRLIEAAKKYSFNLVLAGFIKGEKEKSNLKSMIGDSSNISYVGILSDEELNAYYKRAKVFALPSTNEGVGLVALEAAAYGSEIVLTNLGGPKYYYNGMAALVDPYNIDDIGQTIVSCLRDGKSQPKLMTYIKEHYSLKVCSLRLAEVIKTIQTMK